MANTLTYEELKGLVASLITANKISYNTFSVTRDNLVGLVDKIGKIFDLDTNFRVDKLSRFDKEAMVLGRTIEEWQADLPEVASYDASGSGALSPNSSTFRPPFYSYTFGRKVVKQTIPYDNIERAVNNAEEFTSIVARLYARIEDTLAQYKYAIKREMLGKYAGLALYEMDAANASAYSTGTAYSVGTLVKNGSPAKVGIVFKPIANTNTHTWAQAISAGEVVLLDLAEELALPVDESTGEAFIKRVKELAEKASDISQGCSLNGNALGVVGDIVLIVKQGVMPSIEVDTLAGAFHEDKLAMGADVIRVPDFGSDTNNVYAILMDARGMGLYEGYRATRENLNGDGDFLNIFAHYEGTAHCSRNTFIHVFKKPA